MSSYTKIFTLFFISIFAFPLFADTDLLQTCKVKIPQFNGWVSNECQLIEIFYCAEDDYLFGRVTDKDVITDSDAKYENFDINPAIFELKEDSLDYNKLNYGEKLLLHARNLSSKPLFEEIYKVPFDLKLSRSVKVYIVDNESNMSSTTIIEASDAEGKVLGAFLGGFIVTPCLQ